MDAASVTTCCRARWMKGSPPASMIPTEAVAQNVALPRWRATLSGPVDQNGSSSDSTLSWMTEAA